MSSALGGLATIFGRLEDPRKARGIRHPFAGIVSLVFLSLLGRMTEMGVIARWATTYWGEP